MDSVSIARDGRPDVRLPLEPLIAFCGEVVSLQEMPRQGRYGRLESQVQKPHTGHGAVAVVTGRSTRASRRWGEVGIGLTSAEDIAFDLGVHPFDIWGSAYYEGVDNDDDL